MDDRKQFLGRGWAYPVAIDPQTGLVASCEHEEDIRQSITIILGTVRGERVMRPDFGCGIHELVFEVMDSASLQRVRSLVDEALTRYEPRIEINGINIDPDGETAGVMRIELEYRVRLTNQVDNLVYPFYFKEGGAR
jgi:phage baseplate assembly protein W